MHEDSVPFLGISYKGQFYVWRSLPFGLSPACWVFTKVTRVLLRKWKETGHSCSGYIDDSIHAHHAQSTLEKIMSTLVLPDFLAAGFIVNIKKTMTTACQQARYLGMLIDSIAGHISVPQPKWLALMSLVAKAIATSNHCDLHLLEIITGTISSMHWAFGPLARLESMSIHKSMVGSKSNFIKLSTKAIDNLLFWRDEAHSFNGHRSLWPDRNHDLVIYTDAAGNNRHHAGGWAGWTLIEGKQVIAKGAWPLKHYQPINEHKKGASSSFLEVLAIFMVIISLNERGALNGKRLLIKTDSQVADTVITKAGSRAADIHKVFKDLWWYCHQHGIVIQSSWIPRDLNEFADHYSKRIDWSDVQLNHEVYLDLQMAWRVQFDTDLFASHESRHTGRFFSFFWTPGNSGVNAFAQQWGHNSFAFPPYKLIPRVLEQAKRQRVSNFCLIIPRWPLATWWHRLTENGISFRSEVIKCKTLPRSAPSGYPLLCPGPSNAQDKWMDANWDTMALLMDFSEAIGTYERAGVPVPQGF